ncbi:DUF2493 domain-containing protein [Pelagerythrobacter marinus]|uniref:DUF2493 domain-containing protein n=1 Tax=Pelagerythrobacter marinus TaxID=538382 RepID=UPI002AC96BCB|nr:DUF2493 domain-containing protein [Pelagerythrobacter marinus]WPZ08481.1 DUF2493 domain-containing protein [Pelagerythrobacter marinus]
MIRRRLLSSAFAGRKRVKSVAERRLVVTGGRNFSDASLVDRALGAVNKKHGIALLIEGEATGADSLCRDWAEARGIPVRKFPANWTDLSHPDAVIRSRRDGSKYDAKAGTRRNQQMIDEGKPDSAIAFPGGNGTADMVWRLGQSGVPVWDLR